MELLDKMLGLRPEDRRKAWLMGSVFFLAGVAELLNYTSFMALFNGRYGTQYLPVMYIIEAVLLPLEGWMLSWVADRVAKPRFMTAMYVLFMALCLLNGVILFGLRFTDSVWPSFYPILFITSNFVVRQQTLLMWSTAFDLCPTQQAKRIMPFFVSLAILGGAAAGVISRIIAPVLGAETVYLLGPAMLLLGFPNFRKSLKRYLTPLTIREDESGTKETGEAGGRSAGAGAAAAGKASAGKESAGDALPAGGAASAFGYVRDTLRSPFLLAAVGIMTLMPALYFLMEYQFFTSAQEVFADEHELTSFYGFLVTLLFCAAFLLQLVSSKLMDKIGASNVLIAISAVFLASYALVVGFIDSRFALAAVSIGYSFTYLLLYYFAEPSYQLFFKMLPLHKRDGFRFTAQSIAASAGILLGSGLSMIHSEGGVPLFQQALYGAALSALLLGIAWAVRGLYVKELVKHLEVGAAFVRDTLNEVLGSLSGSRLANSLSEQLLHPNEAVREVAIELLRRRPDPARTEELLRCAESSSPRIRVAALQAVHPAGWMTLPPEERLKFLRDPDAEVRAAAFRTLLLTNAPAEEKREWVRMARNDDNPSVLSEALLAMMQTGAAQEAEQAENDLRKLLSEGGEAAVSAMRIIAGLKREEFFFDVLMQMVDSRPSVRIAAVRTLGAIGGEDAAREMIELLIGAETEMRAAIRDALAEIGVKAMPVLLEALRSPHWHVWQAAVSVLGAALGDKELRQDVVPSCVERLNQLEEVRRFSAWIENGSAGEWADLARRRETEIRSIVLDAVWGVMVRFGDERSVPQIRRAIEDPAEEVRDHGLEVLSEGHGDARLAAALLAYYRGGGKNAQAGTADGGNEAPPPVVTDGWMQAIAIKSGVMEGEAALMNRWEYLSALDKMVVLRQVPLFEQISVEELGRLAGIAHENMYEEGEFLVRQGEPAVTLFVVVEGHVEMSGSDAAGKEGTVSVFGPKQSFGESAVFGGHPSPLSAQALFDAVKVLEIEGAELQKLVRLYPDIGIGLLRAAGERIRMLEQLALKLG